MVEGAVGAWGFIAVGGVGRASSVGKISRWGACVVDDVVLDARARARAGTKGQASIVAWMPDCGTTMSSRLARFRSRCNPPIIMAGAPNNNILEPTSRLIRPRTTTTTTDENARVDGLPGFLRASTTTTRTGYRASSMIARETSSSVGTMTPRLTVTPTAGSIGSATAHSSARSLDPTLQILFKTHVPSVRRVAVVV